MKLQEKAPCLAANQVNIGVEIIVLNSVVLSYREVLRNGSMCQTFLSVNIDHVTVCKYRCVECCEYT